MNLVLLISVVLGVAFQNVFKKIYSIKCNGTGVFLLNAITSFAAMIFFAATSKGLNFDLRLLPYAFAFALSFATASVFSTLSITYGSLSLTSLFTSYSLMIPTFYGLVFRDDPISVGLIPGIVLLCISLFLTNSKSEKSEITVKWLIFVFLAFLGNGMCSVVQSIQQIDFDRAFKNEFMIMSYFLVTVITLSISCFSERKHIKVDFSKAWYVGVLCGLFNGVVNLFVMLLQGMMPLSVMFPIISAGGIIITYVISKYFYKESMSKKQFVGFILGTVSVVLLNI